MRNIYGALFVKGIPNFFEKERTLMTQITRINADKISENLFNSLNQCAKRKEHR